MFHFHLIDLISKSVVKKDYLMSICEGSHDIFCCKSDRNDLIIRDQLSLLLFKYSETVYFKESHFNQNIGISSEFAQSFGIFNPSFIKELDDKNEFEIHNVQLRCYYPSISFFFGD